VNVNILFLIDDLLDPLDQKVNSTQQSPVASCKKNVGPILSFWFITFLYLTQNFIIFWWYLKAGYKLYNTENDISVFYIIFI
jgi:hypothetical protein